MPAAPVARPVRAGAGGDPPCRPATGSASSHDQLAGWRDRLDEMGDTTATFEWALRWLAANRPPPSPHAAGARRLPNGQPDRRRRGLAAVLDWELVHIGEVYEDLAWFCIRAWRFGAPASLAAGGLGSVEDFLAAYETGRRRRRRPRGVALVAGGGDAALGRHLPVPGRTSSAGQTRRSNSPRSDAASAKPNGMCWTCWRCAVSGLNGRPTAAELVAAVAEFLDNDVRANTTGSVNFHARVAANVLRIVERELLDQTSAEPLARWRRSASPTRPPWPWRSAPASSTTVAPTCLAGLRTMVRHRLAIAHPGYNGRKPAPPPRSTRSGDQGYVHHRVGRDRRRLQSSCSTRSGTQRHRRGQGGAVRRNKDVLVWHSGGDTRDSAKERASRRVIDWFINATTSRRYEILDRQFFEGGFVQQHILHADGRAMGRSRSICGSASLSWWAPMD